MEIRTRAKRIILGGLDVQEGLLYKLVIYILLVAIGFVYLYPILFMAVTSFMPLEDLISTSVKWVPSYLHLENYRRAAKVLDFWRSFGLTLLVAGLPTLAQVISTALIGYGFARYNFPLKPVLFGLMLSTFIIPAQVTMIPTYIMFHKYGLLGSLQTFIYPALTGQGLKAAIFILIFYQFFRQIPAALEEAAKIDGAGDFQIFLQVAVPLAKPAILVVFLFSFVWYWNETYLAGLYLGNRLTTLQLELQRFTDAYFRMYPAGENIANHLNEGIKLAGTLLSILPLLVMYLFLQRWFVESADRTGITGE